jgi:cytochrome P450
VIEQKNEFIRVLESVMMGSGIGVELPWLAAIGRSIPSQTLQTLFNGNSFLLEYGTKAVATTRSQAGLKNIFANAIATADEGADTLTDLDIRIEAANFIVAGSDTTGITLTYLTWAVLQRPEVRVALEEEVGQLPADFTETDLETLPLLNATIDETLRLYGAAPGSLPRIVPKGGAQLGGYFVPEGFTVSTQSYSMHRDPKLFTDPERYVYTNSIDTEILLKESLDSIHGAGSTQQILCQKRQR